MTETATQRVYCAIRERIIHLELEPGALIVESALADEMGTGRTPVREALKMLACENLVVVVPQRGIYVAEITIRDLQEIAELRVEIEALAARLAARRITAEQLRHLRDLSARLATVAPDDAEGLMEIDRQLHVAIASAAGNQHLASVLIDLYDKACRIWRLAMPSMGFLAGYVERHDELLDAIEYGNAEAADRVAREHIAGFHEKIRSVF